MTTRGLFAALAFFVATSTGCFSDRGVAGSADASGADDGSESDGGSTGDTGSTGDAGSHSGSDSSGEPSSTTDDPTSATESVGESSETGTVCRSRSMAPVQHPAFRGSSGCAGVGKNRVMIDSEGVANHSNEFCMTEQNCGEGGCAPAPELNLDSDMVVYAFSVQGACELIVDITEIEDCPDSIVVHYHSHAIGPCDTEVRAWDSVLTGYSTKPIAFEEDVTFDP